MAERMPIVKIMTLPERTSGLSLEEFPTITRRITRRWFGASRRAPRILQLGHTPSAREIH
jgi:hypothetical protein